MTFPTISGKKVSELSSSNKTEKGSFTDGQNAKPSSHDVRINRTATTSKTLFNPPISSTNPFSVGFFPLSRHALGNSLDERVVKRRPLRDTHNKMVVNIIKRQPQLFCSESLKTAYSSTSCWNFFHSPDTFPIHTYFPQLFDWSSANHTDWSGQCRIHRIDLCRLRLEPVSTRRSDSPHGHINRFLLVTFAQCTARAMVSDALGLPPGLFHPQNDCLIFCHEPQF